MPMDWRTAYFEQAQSDYRMLLKLAADDDAPVSDCLHYLQMATEKLAKGFRTEAGQGPHEKTHDAFAAFVKNYARLNTNLKRASGFDDTTQYLMYLEGLRDLAQQIEDLSPEGESHPNPEYPWEVNGVIYVPHSYPFTQLDIRNQSPKMTKLLNFIDTCFATI